MSPLDTYPAAYAQAVRWLSRRSYGERELARRLEQQGAVPEVTRQVVARCRELGYLDDAAFAQSRVRLRFRQGHGAVRVRAELSYLGIDAQVIQTALEEKLAESDPVEMALQVLQKRFGALSAPGATLNGKERRQRYDFLARRGFDAEVIEAALSHRS